MDSAESIEQLLVIPVYMVFLCHLTLPIVFLPLNVATLVKNIHLIGYRMSMIVCRDQYSFYSQTSPNIEYFHGCYLVFWH